MGQFGIGQPMTRKEDQRFITGTGRYTDDIRLPGAAHGFVLRAPFAHANFKIGDLSAAKAAPGVLAVLTGADIARDGIGDIPCRVPIKNIDGSMSVLPPFPILAQDTVRHVGDAVAFIVAETVEQAQDASELIEVDYEDLPAIADTGGAMAPGAPQVWPQAKNNVCFDWEMGDGKAAEANAAKAHHVTRIRLVNNRLVVNSMETRVALGTYDPAQDSYELYTTSQGSHTLRGLLAENIFKVAPEKIRVVTPDVGGGFGMKLFLYREHALVMYAAKKIGRPVRWVASRSDGFVSDTQGRDHVTDAALAMDKDGNFLSLQVHITANLGAYLSNFSTYVPTMAGSNMYQGLYKTPAVHVHVHGVFTNTVPVDAYRGAGRPEAAYLVERLVDKAAREIGLSPDEIRRRNFIPPEAMPYSTALGDVYDSGEFTAHMELAMKKADWAGISSRKAEAKQRGKLRGIGISTYVEACGGGSDETAIVSVNDDGGATVLIGTQSNGQGHETAYAQIVSEHLGLPLEQITVKQGDTAEIATGRGTGGSRSVPVGGAALDGASLKLKEKAQKLAAHLLEAAEADIEFENAVFTIAGTDRRMTLAEVAGAASDPAKLPEGMEPGLKIENAWKPPAATFPNGTHICELDIDRDTGVVEILKYTVMDDFGKIINPLLLAGQVHGGVAQGIGQALYEHTVYDSETGQLITGSFMDYCMPRADQVPFVDFDMHNVPCTTNALGIKGCGEAGAIGAPPAVINALVDALQEYGVDHIDMPATAQVIWQKIQAGTVRAAA